MITTSEQLFDITSSIRDTWLFIVDFVTEHHRSPTIPEITDSMGLPSEVATIYRLLVLERHGIITRASCDDPLCHGYSLFVWPLIKQYLVVEINVDGQWQYGVVAEDEKPDDCYTIYGPCDKDGAWMYLWWLGIPNREVAK